MDLAIALRKIHEWSTAEADLGRDYWRSVARLLEDANTLQARVEDLRAQVDRLERSEQTLKRKLSHGTSARKTRSSSPK